MATKTTAKAAKVEPAKTTAAKAAEKKTAEKAVEKKPAAKKTAAKTTTTRKTAAAKKEMKVNAYVEFAGRQVEEKTIVADVKKAWTKSGNKVGDIKTMELYIKPEESTAYYVINGTETGSVAF